MQDHGQVSRDHSIRRRLGTAEAGQADTESGARLARGCSSHIFHGLIACTHTQLLEEQAAARDSSSDCVLLYQHAPVFTLGTGSTVDHIKFEPDAAPFDTFRVERGGEVTYHGPGQVPT